MSSATSLRVYTLGHSNRSLEGLFSVLEAHGIELVCDVRRYPGSRRHPHFDRTALETSMTDAGLEYVWLGGDLGGQRPPPPADCKHIALAHLGLRAYADHMATDAFHTAVAELLRRACEVPTVALCAEREWRKCHRALLADALVGLFDVEVVHLTDESGGDPHRLQRAARVEDHRLIYDVRRGGDQLRLWS